MATTAPGPGGCLLGGADVASGVPGGDGVAGGRGHGANDQGIGASAAIG